MNSSYCGDRAVSSMVRPPVDVAPPRRSGAPPPSISPGLSRRRAPRYRSPVPSTTIPYEAAMILHRGATLPLLAILLAGCAPKPDRPAALAPARYLYVWAGTGNDTTTGIDMMTVVDADPSSKAYASVLAALTVDSGGKM